MKKVLIMPVVVAALLTAACGGDSDPTAPDTRASVRFFNATTGMTGSGGFTTNGEFTAGSAVGFGQVTQTCSKVEAGTMSFAFGAANPGGSGLSGSALATLGSQTLEAGGNYTVIAAGPAASPKLYLIDNAFAGAPTLTSSQVAVRFVNLAPGPTTAPNNFAVFSGVFGQDATFLAQNFAAGTPSMFRALPGGSQKFSMLRNHEEPPAIPERTFNLQAGGVYTIAIFEKGTGGYEMTPIPSC